MSDYIEKAEIFSENEIAAVLAGANKQSFIGYEIGKEAMGFEKELGGINSLLRRRVLKMDGEVYRFSEEHRSMFETLTDPAGVFILSGEAGVLYSGSELVLMQRQEAEPARFSLRRVTAASLADKLADEGLLPDRDEDSIFARSLSEAEAMDEQSISAAEESFIIKRYGSDSFAAVFRAGLCMAMRLCLPGGSETKIFQRSGFVSMLDALLKER